ncbi:hypothetical protein [Acetivibrio mesophilus]|uniref:Rubrerythrin diiron-binding domain-containing protein n=1 Tax=Acetivibrio mesophilus TaxID=2487273 RepID=A0A4Q0I5R4_9FIRM|nr:hypothetical protein [Acetivibrio mesophilus]ODM25988.1 hypothetical protein A7W90_06970 [Clostridium sp. Bc-iso-3]RXE59217.1 hypothetical protein EFD62_08715 [Acetivibrio mesophilus]HHV29231.1 hypothetical protein [Clostridium sp.]
MEKQSQQYILNIAFTESINREELLIKKYEHYFKISKDKELKNILRDFSQNSRDHIKMINDKMILLSIDKK